MGAPTKAPRRQERIFAFKVLYSLCFTEAVTTEELQNVFLRSPDKPETATSAEGFAWELVQGVQKKYDILDKVISSFSENWRIERIGKVELTLLRIAIYELMYKADIPPKAALNEAIELSKLFGDDKSRSFVNGILDAAAKTLESGEITRKSE